MTLTGKYNALDEDQLAQAADDDEAYEGEKSPIGGVAGMLTDQYRDSISSEFHIYEEPEDETESETETAAFSMRARAKAKTTSTLNFRYRQDDMTQDAGIIVKKETPAETPKQIATRRSSGGGGSTRKIPAEKKQPDILMVEPKPDDLTLPQTGGTLAAYTALGLAAVGAVGFFMTGSKREGKKRGRKRGRKQ
jgi:LPXTG-motif cell wall-anchored protein